MTILAIAARPPWRSALFLFLWAVVMALASGCAVQTQALRQAPPTGVAQRVELERTPFFAQTEYQCGPAALATALGAAGLPADPAVLGEQVFLPARTGTLQIEMMAGARRQGAVAARIPGTLEALVREVDAGRPVVVLLNLGLSFAPTWHYAVVVGYDIQAGDVLLRSGTTRRAVMAMRTFEHTWARSGHWAFVVLPPGQWPVQAEEKSVVEAAIGFERSGAPASAVLVYRSALQRFPESLSLRMGLGNALYASGDKPAAAQAFRDAAERHRSAPAWINLSATLIELRSRDEAVKAAREAVAAADSNWRDKAEAALAAAMRTGP